LLMFELPGQNTEIELPRLLITMGDVAGIGPEIIVRAWPELVSVCRPVVVGDPGWLERATALVPSPLAVKVIASPNELQPEPEAIACLVGSNQDLRHVSPGSVDAHAGRAAYEFLCRAIDLNMAGAADGIVTAPLHKEGLRAAGLSYPGHTEI